MRGVSDPGGASDASVGGVSDPGAVQNPNVLEPRVVFETYH